MARSNLYDAHVHRMYAARAAAIGLEIDDRGIGWWGPPRRDLIDSPVDFAWLATQLRAHNDIHVRRAGHPTDVRLLDIIAWMLGRQT